MGLLPFGRQGGQATRTFRGQDAPAIGDAKPPPPVVAVRQDGTRRLHAIRPEGLESLDRFLAELWPAGLQRLKAAVEADDRR